MKKSLNEKRYSESVDQSMSETDFYVIGGGPAGVATAYFLHQKGFKVEIFESKDVLGMKPCGSGVPDEINKWLSVPSQSVLREIYGMDIYFENEEIGSWKANRPIFYIIDRTKYLESVVSSTDIKVHRKSTVKIRNNAFVTPQGKSLEKEKVIIATGVSWRFNERDMVAQTLQYVIEDVEMSDSETLKFLFFKDLVGYAWIFPKGDREVEVGIGSLNKDIERMESILLDVIKKFGFDKGTVKRREGAPIDMGGLKPEWGGNGPYVVGEAVGAVMPLTGEGIRPSIVTASLLAHSLDKGNDYVKALRNSSLYKATRLQRKLLEKVYKNRIKIPLEGVKLDPRSVEAIYNFGMGKLDVKTLFHLAKKLPSVFLNVL